MTILKNISLLDGSKREVKLKDNSDQTIDCKHLTMLPALIDPHVHFRVPGHDYKEDWKTAAEAALAGGITTVIDMPNTSPPTVTKQRLDEKKALIEKQLNSVQIPLRSYFYLGADERYLDEIPKCKKDIVGIKVYMGESTGDLLMHEGKALEKVFQFAAQENLLVTCHAEDETILKEMKQRYSGEKDISFHSKIRPREAAIKATEYALFLAEKYSAQVMIAHVTTLEEIDLIRKAKKRGTLVYAEVTPHHLFLDESAYKTLGTKAQMNPPLRTKKDCEALWEGILDTTVDVIGSDHAPHTIEEKNQPYGATPSGVPGLETTLPLLLTAEKQGLLSLEKIVELTRINPERIFRLPPNGDAVLVDRNTKKAVGNLKTKCGWSPFEGKELIGWPHYTILREHLYHVA